MTYTDDLAVVREALAGPSAYKAAALAALDRMVREYVSALTFIHQTAEIKCEECAGDLAATEWLAPPRGPAAPLKYHPGFVHSSDVTCPKCPGWGGGAQG